MSPAKGFLVEGDGETPEELLPVKRDSTKLPDSKKGSLMFFNASFSPFAVFLFSPLLMDLGVLL